MEASEKNRSRDKMIIKFREERIAELESRLSKSEESDAASSGVETDASSQAECASLRK